MTTSATSMRTSMRTPTLVPWDTHCRNSDPAEQGPAIAMAHPTSARDPDPQRLIDPALGASWVVLSRDTPARMLIAGAILGAGMALSIAGLAIGTRWLWAALPMALVVAQMVRTLYRWSEDRAIEAVRDREGRCPARR